MPVPAGPPRSADERPTIVLCIGQPRVAAAVERLLRAEDRYDVQSRGLSAFPREAALAIVDARSLTRSSRPIVVPAVVLLRSDLERETLGTRVTDVREWLRTSSTGDELLAAIDRALRVPRVIPAPAALGMDEPVPQLEARRATAAELALLAFGTASGAISLAMIWQAIRP